MPSAREAPPAGDVQPATVRPTAARSALRRFGVAVLAVGAVVAVRMVLNPLLGRGSPFLLFTPAVMLAAWYGGRWPGLLATGLSAALGVQFLGGPRTPLSLEDLDRLALFLVVGAATTLLQVKVGEAGERIKALLASEQAARAEAEAANRSKDEFLATVSHELRTPLSAIVGWSAMLEDHGQDPERVRKAAEVITRNARLQQRLVEDLLDSVRVARGTMRLHRERIDLASTVAAAADASRPAALERGISVSLRAQPGESVIWGDPARLHQVLLNLLGNATKFTPEGGTIEVGLECTSDTARVTVCDTGNGIAPELLPHVFEPFRKGHDASAGLGLGLSIVRHIVGMHGGTVTVDSPGIGRGTSFVLTFPVLGVSAAQPAVSLTGGLSASA